MSYLLDTHAFLWWVSDDARLTQTARNIIGSRENECFFSVVSAWEIAVKSQIGRLELKISLSSFLTNTIQSNAFRVLPVGLTHALKLHTLQIHHRDPFDRMLVAQALEENLTLLSNDRKIKSYPVDVLW